ncbi:hypothetical protein Tco_0277506 [Tanacetum coccineum]
METIHVKFDELTTMASEHDSLEPISQRFLNDDSSAESMNTPSKEDLDNLFRPMYDEYFEKKSSDMPINFAAQQVHNQEDSSSTSSIDIEAHEAPSIVTISEEQTSPISLTVVDEFYQEDSVELDGNTLLTPYDAPDFSEVESSTNLDPLNMHEFHQNKGKEVVKPVIPPFESASEEDSDEEQPQRDNQIQKRLALIAKYFKNIYKPTNNNLRTSSNTRNKNRDTSPRNMNDNQTEQFVNQRTIIVVGARETIGNQVVQQTGI